MSLWMIQLHRAYCLKPHAIMQNMLYGRHQVHPWHPPLAVSKRMASACMWWMHARIWLMLPPLAQHPRLHHASSCKRSAVDEAAEFTRTVSRSTMFASSGGSSK